MSSRKRSYSIDLTTSSHSGEKINFGKKASSFGKGSRRKFGKNSGRLVIANLRSRVKKRKQKQLQKTSLIKRRNNNDDDTNDRNSNASSDDNSNSCVVIDDDVEILNSIVRAHNPPPRPKPKPFPMTDEEYALALHAELNRNNQMSNAHVVTVNAELSQDEIDAQLAKALQDELNRSVPPNIPTRHYRHNHNHHHRRHFHNAFHVNRRHRFNSIMPMNHHNINIDSMDYEQLSQFCEQQGEVKKRGLDDAKVLQFPSFEYVGKGNEKSCSVCLTEFELNESLRALPCLHTFHSECIDPWLKQKAKCPVCQYDIK